MKRPKQQTQPLSFLSFFSQKPKSDPRLERPAGALNKEEVSITLTPSEHAEQVHGRWKKKNMSGSKRYLTVASGVMMPMFVSPVIAAVTVGVGVPLMLTYVHGVVPMSLCRNGWCRPRNEPPETHKIHLEGQLEGTNVDVPQPRGARQSSLSSVLSIRSLSAESLDRTHSIGHAHSQDHLGHSHSREHLDSAHSQEYLCASESEGEGEEEGGRDRGSMDHLLYF